MHNKASVLVGVIRETSTPRRASEKRRRRQNPGEYVLSGCPIHGKRSDDGEAEVGVVRENHSGLRLKDGQGGAERCAVIAMAGKGPDLGRETWAGGQRGQPEGGRWETRC